MSTTTRPGTPAAAPADRARQRLRELAFTSAEEMPEGAELPVVGELPAWLRGQLLRNGPGRWDFGGTAVHHWFDGMSLLHSFEVDAGRVTYRNRFVESKAYTAFRDTGKLKYSEFASDPCRTRFQRIQSMFQPQVTDNPAINAFKFGEHYMALSETPMAYEFDPSTLETLGVLYENPDMFATAHPHESPEGHMLNLAGKFGPRSTQTFFSMDPATLEAKRIGGVRRQRPTYQHSFGMTDRWLILTEFPFSVNPVDILRTGRPFIENFKWQPEAGTRIVLIDRRTGERGGEWEAEPGFCFHHVNAWEEGDDVVLDLCRFDDPSIVENLALAQLRAGADYPEDGNAYLHRYRLRPGAPRAQETRLSDAPIELPRINYRRHNGRAYRYVYGVGSGADVPFDRLVKIDAMWGAVREWREPDALVGEPVFVATPGGAAEDDGVLLSLVLDGRAERSMLLVLDAADLSELARATISRAVPPGFHGNFVRAK
ncbi:MAG: carotenoid oxygenase family protein [Solirubrobacteraceae bacterium]|nr:carotenoid oxygenase family protein [Solirubrobacteraceae bacterium]